MADTQDYELILKLSAGCSLDSSPKKNWVENSGGLPNYICKIAKGVMRSGKSKSAAIAIAVSRVKKWAAGGDGVDADTKAKAATAVAQWNKLKAKNKAGKVIAASYVTPAGEEDNYLMLTEIPSYKTDIVRMAWEGVERVRRRQWEADNPRPDDRYSDSTEVRESYYPYRWIKELWTDFILVEEEGAPHARIVKVPFTVNPITHDVTFGAEVEVRQLWIEMDDDLSDAEKVLLADLL